jgi:hypothetical protein
MGKRIDETGNVYGLLTVKSFSGITHNGKACWVCECSCGKIVTVCGSDLRQRNSKSCGSHGKKGKTIHGFARTSIYSRWKNMRMRCSNEKDPAYSDYGGRGITVFEEWADKKGFPKFYEYVETFLGGPPKPGYSLDRINNDGNYEPGNLRWADRSTQRKNKRRSVAIENHSDEALLREVRRRGLLPPHAIN